MLRLCRYAIAVVFANIGKLRVLIVIILVVVIVIGVMIPMMGVGFCGGLWLRMLSEGRLILTGSVYRA